MDLINFNEENINTNEENININNNENIIININNNENNNKNNRYENIIELMGLNSNIDYPLKIIIEGIVEMHMIKTTENKINSMYSRVYRFKEDEISTKICDILFGHVVINVSKMSIGRNIRRLYRNNKYNKIIMNVDNKQTETLGFNYDNPRWSQLESFILE